MPTMSKVIFFIRPMHGHVNPTLGLVNELVQRGEEVIYYTTEAFREKIRAAGAECRYYADSGKQLNRGMAPDMDPGETESQDISFEKQLENIFGDLSSRMEDVKTQELHLYEEIKAQEPDYIIYDYVDAFWGKMLARKLGIPAIASIPSFALCRQLSEKDPLGIITFILNMSPHAPPFKDNTIELNDLICFISSRIGSTYNIHNFNMLDYGNSELLNIVYTSRYFHPHGELYDDTFSFIGCSIHPGTETVAFPFEALEKGPVIYVSLGTNFNRRTEFYKNCIEAFKNSAKQVVLAIGNRITAAELGKIPGNFIVRPFVPQLAILERASLFITHGGLNSVREGIHYKVPLMVFPQHGDQFAVAHQVQRLGAGKSFAHSLLTPGALREAAQQVDDNKVFCRNCQRIKESFENAGGAKRGVDELFKLKNKIGIK
jgi:MGT family glycosyltransferase